MRPGMTAPRRVVPNTTYLITRRCFGRAFFLRPSALVNAVFEYALAVTARRYGILLHCYCVLSNHYHLVLTDPLGKLPEFERDLGSILARALNSALGRFESFWAPGSYSAVALLAPADVLDKMAYVLANPAAAGLVQTGSDWPGLWSEPASIGAGPREVRRPEHFFRAEGNAPETAELELVGPPGFGSAEDLRQQLARALATREEQARQEAAAEGRSFLGALAVLAQKPFGRPRSNEPRGGLKPRVASRDKWKRIEALGRLKAFLTEYREAWRAFKDGARTTVFPEGTYWMRVAYGVACAAGG
jgi:REP element-mobilizing transposase RayT